MSYQFLSLLIAILIYFIFVCSYKLGGWIVKNENKRWIKVLNKISTILFNGFALFILWFLISQILHKLTYLKI